MSFNNMNITIPIDILIKGRAYNLPYELHAHLC